MYIYIYKLHAYMCVYVRVDAHTIMRKGNGPGLELSRPGPCSHVFLLCLFAFIRSQAKIRNRLGTALSHEQPP